MQPTTRNSSNPSNPSSPLYSRRRLLSYLTAVCAASAIPFAAAHAQMLGAAMPGASVTSPALHLNVGRFGANAALVGRSIYVLGGLTEKGYTSDIERIDLDKGTVTLLPTKLTGRLYAMAQAHGPYIYLIGGYTAPQGEGQKGQLVERYDTRDGSVKTMAPLTVGRHAAGCAIDGNYIYLVGGSTFDDKSLNLLTIYNIEGNRWTDGPPMTTPRECSAAICDQKLYVVGGYNGKTALTTVEAYSLFNNRWYACPDLPTPLSANHLAVDGHVIRTFGDYGTLTGLYQGDMRRGTWSLIPTPLGYVPHRHDAVVVAPDAVYVIGGNGSPTNPGFNAIQRFPRLTTR